jgi:hypothetical protein
MPQRLQRYRRAAQRCTDQRCTDQRKHISPPGGPGRRASPAGCRAGSSRRPKRRAGSSQQHIRPGLLGDAAPGGTVGRRALRRLALVRLGARALGRSRVGAHIQAPGRLSAWAPHTAMQRHAACSTDTLSQVSRRSSFVQQQLELLSWRSLRLELDPTSRSRCVGLRACMARAACGACGAHGVWLGFAASRRSALRGHWAACGRWRAFVSRLSAGSG